MARIGAVEIFTVEHTAAADGVRREWLLPSVRTNFITGDKFCPMDIKYTSKALSYTKRPSTLITSLRPTMLRRHTPVLGCKNC